MNKVYKRYFKITGDLLCHVNNFLNERNLVIDRINKLKEKYNIEDVYTSRESIGFVTFKNEDINRNTWRKVKSGFYPKKSDKLGKLILKEFEEIKLPSEQETIKLMIGTSGKRVVCSSESGGIMAYSVGFRGDGSTGYFLTCPWKDGIKNYLPEPIPSGLIEIKKWEYEKIISGD